MAPGRARTGSQIRGYQFPCGRQEPPVRHWGSQRALRRIGRVFLLRGHCRTLERSVLELARPCLLNRISWRQCGASSSVSHCFCFFCVQFSSFFLFLISLHYLVFASFIFGVFFDREEQNLKQKPREEYAEDVKKKKLSEMDPEVGIVVAKC